VLAYRDRRASASTSEARAPQRRMLVAGPLVAVVSMAAALIAVNAAGISLRDPDHVAGRRLVLVFALVGLLVVLDIAVRANRRSPGRMPAWAAMAEVRRERWTFDRGIAVATALISFYVSYLAYRNLKSVVPLLRPGELFDRQLADFDRAMFGGNDPAVLLHSLLGTGVASYACSAAYMMFFVFIPGTLAAALVFSPNLQAGLFYASAQSLNWLLGAASYFVLPSLGPVYVEPSVFANLPASGITQLQELLMDQRIEFVRDPAIGTAQSIAAFASLHVSIFFTGALAAHMLGLGRRVRIAAWVLLALTTTATIYLGWHYVVDDIGGLALGAMAIVLARALTGFDVRPRRRLSTAKPATAA
jgi:PAP2 superfamily protein